LTDATYELVIGIETHVQLLTHSKMFCACSADYDGAEPNTHVCPVCLGLPGTLPTPNATAIALAVRTGLALGCQIVPVTTFERKNYHYPDLPKGYQISQYAEPLAIGGTLGIEDGGAGRTIGIERVHLEEDTAKNTHVGASTLVDVNRAGVPLLEIVSRPDLRSPDEAKAYLEALRQLLRWIGVSSGNMEAGALRADVNVSVRRRGETELGVKIEIKNLNSFAAVKSALEHERGRLVAAAEAGAPIVQETRGWVEAEGRTTSQRSKEFAQDYRYFPEPDLPPIVLDPAWIEALRADLPELPAARRARFATAWGLGAEEARLLARDRATANYFEAAVSTYDGEAAKLAHWITGPLFGAQNAAGLDIDATAGRVPPANLATLVTLTDQGTLSTSAAREVLAQMLDTGADAATIVAREGLGQISDADALRRVVAAVLAAHPEAVSDYCGGKATAIGFLVGGVMRQTRGQANPGLVRELLEAALADVCRQ
jgi:aspartyl-tRNA(Asn)/glutamyl-tRNA(Gln) amidotransferase subunit B